jgi:hypothetical protein
VRTVERGDVIVHADVVDDVVVAHVGALAAVIELALLVVTTGAVRGIDGAAAVVLLLLLLLLVVVVAAVAAPRGVEGAVSAPVDIGSARGDVGAECVPSSAAACRASARNEDARITATAHARCGVGESGSELRATNGNAMRGI